MRLRKVRLAETFAMGLELVEIVMDVEETFGISLPDARMSAIRTVGEFCDCITGVLSRDYEESGLADKMFNRVCCALHSARGIARSEIFPDKPLNELFPVWGRRTAWRRFQKSLGLELPPLQRSHLVNTLITVIAIALGWISVLSVVTDFMPRRIVSLPVTGVLSIMLLVFAAIPIWWLIGRWLTLPTAVFWRSDLRTVDDLTRAAFSRNYGKIVKEQGQFSCQETWIIVQGIVSKHLGVDRAAVTREARFVEDLGAG